MAIANEQLASMPSTAVKLNSNTTVQKPSDFVMTTDSLLGRDLAGIVNIPQSRFSVASPTGRIFYVSKQGNDATGTVGRIDRTYLTIQAAINASIAGDTIRVFNGTYAEALNFGTTQNRTLVLVDADVTSITTNVINLAVFGQIIGIGRSSCGSINAIGNNTHRARVSNLTLTGSVTGFVDNCVFNLTSSIFISPYKIRNCTINSTATDFIPTYGAETGVNIENTEINCVNFSTFVGGLSSGGGTHKLKNCTINATGNFISHRGVSNIIIEGGSIKVGGSSYFFRQDDATVTSYLQITDTKLQYAGTNLTNNAYNANSIFNCVGSKPIGGVYNGSYIEIPSLTLF